MGRRVSTRRTPQGPRRRADGPQVGASPLTEAETHTIERSAVLNGEPDEFSTSKILGTVGEIIPAIAKLINSAETSIVFAAQPGFSLISMGRFLRHLACAVGLDVRVRGVLDISLQNIVAGTDTSATASSCVTCTRIADQRW